MVRTALTRSRGACLSPRPGCRVRLSTGYVLCYCATAVAVSELQSIREMGAGRDTCEQELHRPLPRPEHPHAPAGVSPTTAEERGHLLAILCMAADWPPWVQIPGRAPWLPAPAGLSTQAHPRRLRHQGQPANPAPGPPAWTQAPGRSPRVQALALLTCRLRCWACPAKDPSSRRTCDHRRMARLEPGFACWSLSVKAVRGAAFANGGHRREATRARSNRDTSRHRRRLTELHRLTRKKRGVHGLSDEERRRTPPKVNTRRGGAASPASAAPRDEPRRARRGTHETLQGARTEKEANRLGHRPEGSASAPGAPPREGLARVHGETCTRMFTGRRSKRPPNRGWGGANAPQEWNGHRGDRAKQKKPEEKLQIT